MKLKIFTASDLDRNLKATVHKSGKLGFSREAAEKMKLNPNMSVDAAMNEDDPSDDSIYLVLHNDATSGLFKVVKAGRYYYINTKILFDKLGLKYKDVIPALSFDLKVVTEGGETYYALKKRDTSKKTKQAVNVDDL